MYADLSEKAEVAGFGLNVGRLDLDPGLSPTSTQWSSCWGFRDGHCSWFSSDEPNAPTSCSMYHKYPPKKP